MDSTAITYIVYLGASIGLTVWVGRTLFHNGRFFLLDIFEGNAGLADAVNRLLIVGFYLVNLGFVALNIRADAVTSLDQGIETLAGKLGLILFILGGMHFFNLYALNRVRHSRLFPRPLRPAPPPLAPPVPPAGAAW